MTLVARGGRRQRGAEADAAAADRAPFLGALAGKVVAVWGLAFKPRTDDMREAPALAADPGAAEGGAAVRAYDPKAMDAARAVLGDRVTFTARSYEAVEGADALVVATEWNEFREPDFPRIKRRMRRPAVFDGRNIYNPAVAAGPGLPLRGHRPPVKVLVTGGAGYIGSHAVRGPARGRARGARARRPLARATARRCPRACRWW